MYGVLGQEQAELGGMTKLAIHVEPTSTLKPVGFKVGAGFVQSTTVHVGGDEDED